MIDEKIQTTFQTAILARFLTASEFARFVKNYNANKKTMGIGGNRGTIWQRELSEKEINMLIDYLNPENGVSELAQKYNISPSAFTSKVRTISLMFIFKNKDKLGI